MKIYRNRRTLLVLFIVSLSMALGACATLKSKTSEEALRERIQGMMQAKINNDWGTVYTYFDESFQKTESKEVFSNKTRDMVFKAYTIESIDMSPTGKDATVKIKNDIQTHGYDFNGTPATQQWIVENGEWRLQVPMDDNSKK